MEGPLRRGSVTARLRQAETRLRARGVTGLWLFGSVARDDAHADSDVDLLAEFDPVARVSIVTLASLRSELSELLGAPLDLVERDALTSEARAGLDIDAVRVL